jgi:hypothetical protein
LASLYSTTIATKLAPAPVGKLPIELVDTDWVPTGIPALLNAWRAVSKPGTASPERLYQKLLTLKMYSRRFTRHDLPSRSLEYRSQIVCESATFWIEQLASNKDRLWID